MKMVSGIRFGIYSGPFPMLSSMQTKRTGLCAKWLGSDRMLAKRTRVHALTRQGANRKKRGLWYNLTKYRYLHLLAFIPVLYFLVFKYLPMYGIIIAFKNVVYIGSISDLMAQPWVGFENFRRFFSSIYFTRLIRNTVLISGYRILFTFPIPILFAIMLNELRAKRFKRVVQTITYMPHFFSWVIVAGLVSMLLSPTLGPLNELIRQISGESISFLTSPKYFRSVLVVSSVWKELGWNAIIYLAAIAGIDTELYEAAMIDGASRLRQTIHITIPGVASIASIMLILSVGKLFGENFEQIFNMYNTAVYEVADVFETYVYRAGLVEAKYSYTAAIGFFQSVLSLVMVVLANVGAKKMGAEGIW